MEILPSMNRPLRVREKMPAGWSTILKVKELRISQARLPLPFRTGKGEPVHLPFILETVIGLSF